MQVRNPRNGQYDYKLSIDSPNQVAQKAHDLRSAQALWDSKGIDHRVNILLEFASKLEERRDDIIDHLSIDTGRKKISQIEFEGAIGLIKGRCFGSPKLMEEVPIRDSYSNPTVQIKQQRVPYQLVGVISPWNFPLLLALIDTVPALLAGCAVLLKPSEVTPRFIDPLEEIVNDISELSGVLKFVRGGADSGSALVDNVDVICFTGSVATGQIIAINAAKNFIPAFLELGGKDPAIVMADADLDVATDAVLRSAAGATGQACQSLERIYVDEKIYNVFVELLCNKVGKTTYNSNYEDGGTMGPLIFDKQTEKIEAQLREATSKGAQIKTGGTVDKINGGSWMMPTVVIDVTHDMSLMTEETFGPVIPVMSYSDINEAIALANDSVYGLSGSVFSKDIDQAVMVASQIEAGGMSINDGSLTNQVFDATKNSFKLSGLNGSRMGNDGFTRFFRTKALLIQTAHPKSIHSQDEEGLVNR